MECVVNCTIQLFVSEWCALTWHQLPSSNVILITPRETNFSKHILRWTASLVEKSKLFPFLYSYVNEDLPLSPLNNTVITVESTNHLIQAPDSVSPSLRCRLLLTPQPCLVYSSGSSGGCISCSVQNVNVYLPWWPTATPSAIARNMIARRSCVPPESQCPPGGEHCLPLRFNLWRHTFALLTGKTCSN